ncbi:DNA methyltransferase [Vibrio chagasii]|uniref:DNA methyltransferase n=1 Tax=Vibrio chagasii TaxID=170679 RepID=UPI003DA8DD63
MKQENLFDTEGGNKASGPVECLGMTFESDEARRAHFSDLLRDKLKDLEFRAIDGFPIGTDEAILELSDPPYYTACPNPWLNQFVDYCVVSSGKAQGDRHVEPFASDVSEGKNDPIYTSHSYHTKVPHKAIMRYILHYTQPGDIVLDGFCGTGMTGVAAQMCSSEEEVRSLGIEVEKGSIGARKVILNDLSPAASFIASNYNSPVDTEWFEKEAFRILSEVESECGWMFDTIHEIGEIGRINYTILSDVFICSQCSDEVVYWDCALDPDKGKVVDSFECPNCSSMLTKRKLERSFEEKFDDVLNTSLKQAKQVPVSINYTYKGKRYTKQPDANDIALLDKIESLNIPYDFPVMLLPEGQNTSQPKTSHGITHSHHFFTRRNLYVLASLAQKTKECSSHHFDMLINMLTRANKQSSLHVSNYFHGGGGVCKGHLTGTLYIPSLSPEIPALKIFKDRVSTLCRGYRKTDLFRKDNCIISAGSLADLSLDNDSVDYIFIDPPFGANINYSEVNFNDESWLGVTTNNKPEAIQNATQKKGLDEYRVLMLDCFNNLYRILKPGKWLTIEFSNTKASVWNSIQSALSTSGFIVANVSALDKKQGSFKAVTTTTAVKQDLVISAYKPKDDLDISFNTKGDDYNGVWEFISAHLGFLPITKHQGNELVKIPERDPRILFDQLITACIRKGIQVPISSQGFHEVLFKRFVERDGMVFLPEQVAEYDKKRALSTQVTQFSIFVDDEASAIEWMRQQLKSKPKTYSEIHPLFLNELSGWKKNELELELSTLLEQNFLKYDGKDDVPSQIHTYLSTNFKDMRGLDKSGPKLVAKAKDRWYVPDPNKAADLEKVRLRALLKEFETYKTEKKKIKQPRAEALRAGFNTAWEAQDFQTILDISAKIPPAVLQEDEKLLMFYDNALTLTSTEDDEW